MADSLLAIVLGVGVLYMFYRAVEVEWPESYMTLDSGIDYALTSHPFRYIAFRFLPIYLVTVFAAVSLDRGHVVAWPAVVAICLSHALLHNGRALIGLRNSQQPSRRGPLLVLHAIVAFGVLVAGALALSSRSELVDVIPKPGVLSTALWTAALAGVIGAFVIALSRADTSRSRALGQSRRHISRKLWHAAERLADEADADPLLLKAVMVVENANRPPWFRKLERLKGLAFKRGTYGIMQVDSAEPVSDLDSIRIAADTRFRGVVIPLDEYGYKRDAVRDFALRYNPDPNFADAVAELYSTLWSELHPPSI